MLKLAGCNGEAVEFRAGHELDSTRQAYWLARPDELRKLFSKHYNALRVKTGTQFDQTEVKKLREMLAEKEITVQALTENGKLKVEELKRLRADLDAQRQTLFDLQNAMQKLQPLINLTDREALRFDTTEFLPLPDKEKFTIFYASTPRRSS